MPIEIRELIIKTEIAATGRYQAVDSKGKQLEKLKKQLLQEVKRMMTTASKRNIHKR